jgi:hypothetical protein
MKNQRSSLSHNGHSRRSDGRAQVKTIASRAAEAIGNYVPSNPTYRYGIPVGVAIAGLATTGFFFRKQAFSVAKTVIDGLSIPALLGLVGLERSRSVPMRIAPAAGALALGLVAGAGATVLYVRTRANREPSIGGEGRIGERLDEGSMDVAP